MKYLILIIALFLTGCTGDGCKKVKYRNYKYKDEVTITSGFYKGQKGIITKKSVWIEDNLCTFPSFGVKLEDGKEIHLKQNYLFVESEKEPTTVTCKVVKKEEKKEKECKPCIEPKQPEIEPKEPKEERTTCGKKLEEEAKTCKDINCKLSILRRLKRCPEYNE